MPIVTLARSDGFDPEAVEQLRSVFELCLSQLQLTDRADPITTQVAQEIIQVAKTGIRDTDTLCKIALANLSANNPASER